MKERDIEAAIIELKSILEEMKALLAWHKLKRFEATQHPFSNLMFYDTTLGDLKSKYSSFSLLASQIHAEVNNQNIPKSKLSVIRKQLTKIELQACYLGSGIRFYWQKKVLGLFSQSNNFNPAGFGYFCIFFN